MTEGLLVSNMVLWVIVIVLALVVLALARQVGILHERVAPAGALMPTTGPKVGEMTEAMSLNDLDGKRAHNWRPSRRWIRDTGHVYFADLPNL